MNNSESSDKNLSFANGEEIKSHHFNEKVSEIIVTPRRISELFDVSFLVEQMFKIYARFLNQKKTKYQTGFSAGFDEKDEDDQIVDGIEILFNLKSIQN